MCAKFDPVRPHAVLAGVVGAVFSRMIAKPP